MTSVRNRAWPIRSQSSDDQFREETGRHQLHSDQAEQVKGAQVGACRQEHRQEIECPLEEASGTVFGLPERSGMVLDRDFGHPSSMPVRHDRDESVHLTDQFYFLERLRR
jgi:hypothetical protein